MPQHRTRDQILTEMEQVRTNRALNVRWDEVVRECDARLERLKAELAEVSGPWDDEETPVVPYRKPSDPPSAPRGRPVLPRMPRR